MNSITTLQRRRPLFDIVNDLLNHITASDGVVTETIDALELELQDKTEAYAAVIRQLETEAAGLDDLAHAYKLKAAKRADAAGALKDRLAVALQRAGVDRIEAPTARAFFATTTHVGLADREAFLATAEARFVKCEYAPNLTAIKAAIQAGETVPGAELVAAKYLRVS